MPQYLFIHAPDADPYNLDLYELEDAIEREAATIAADADAELLTEGTPAEREELRQLVIREATAALRQPGDSYLDPTHVRWEIMEEPDHDG